MGLIEGCKLYTIDLTTRNDTDNTGFRKRHSEVTEQDILKAFDNILNKIRYQANRQGWKYAIYAVSSNDHLSIHRKGAWHLHILLYGKPANKICRTIKEYWVKSRYGNAIQQNIEKCWSHGKQKYIIQQASKERFQHFGWTEADTITMCGEANIDRITKKIFLKFSDLIGRIEAINGIADGTVEISKRGWLKKCDTTSVTQIRKPSESKYVGHRESLDNSYFVELWQDIQKSKV